MLDAIGVKDTDTKLVGEGLFTQRVISFPSSMLRGLAPEISSRIILNLDYLLRADFEYHLLSYRLDIRDMWCSFTRRRWPSQGTCLQHFICNPILWHYY